MTNKEAIEAVKEVTGMSLPWNDRHYEALQMAIKALEEPERTKNARKTHECDLISRHAAIDAVCNTKEDTWHELENLPSADSELINKLDFGINASTGDSAYMVGLRNGLRLAKSYVDGNDPQFDECAEPKMEAADIRGEDNA